jgi:hypothetical protein
MPHHHLYEKIKTLWGNRKKYYREEGKLKKNITGGNWIKNYRGKTKYVYFAGD